MVRNPLLYKEEVEKRKKMLKVLLEIPIYMEAIWTKDL